MTAGGLTAQDLRALRAEARAKQQAEARMLAAMAGYNLEIWDARKHRERERRTRSRQQEGAA